MQAFVYYDKMSNNIQICQHPFVTISKPQILKTQDGQKVMNICKEDRTPYFFNNLKDIRTLFDFSSLEYTQSPKCQVTSFKKEKEKRREKKT